VQTLIHLEAHQPQGKHLKNEQSAGEEAATLQLQKMCIQRERVKDHLHLVDAGQTPVGEGLTGAWEPL
jgi:hypothetical protein